MTVTDLPPFVETSFPATYSNILPPAQKKLFIRMFVCISIVVDMQLSALKPKLVTQDSAMYDGNSDPQIDVDEDREGKTLTLALCRETVSTWSQEDRRLFAERL